MEPQIRQIYIQLLREGWNPTQTFYQRIKGRITGTYRIDAIGKISIVLKHSNYPTLGRVIFFLGKKQKKYPRLFEIMHPDGRPLKYGEQLYIKVNNRVVSIHSQNNYTLWEKIKWALYQRLIR